MESSPQLPIPFLQSLERALGNDETAEFMQAYQEEAPTSIRLNPFKKGVHLDESAKIPWCDEGYYLANRPSFTLDPLFHAGTYYVQEASSTFLYHVLSHLAVPKDGVFLDLCAAPGGKSTLLSSYLGNEGLLVANEVISARTQILKENIIKWGLGNTIVTQNDAGQFQELAGFFDLVVIDAPCSGEGMFRKDPKAIKEWSPEHVDLCAGRQQRILDQAGILPKAGGYLMYATCTFNQKENEQNVRFLTEEFSYEPVRIPLGSDWGIVESEIACDSGLFYGYRFFPHRLKGEGLFISILRRPDTSVTTTPKLHKEFRHPHLKRVSVRDIPSELSHQVERVNEESLYALGSAYFLFPKRFQAEFEFLAQHLNLRYMGVFLGEASNGQWIPSHEWAMSILPKDLVVKWEVNLDHALQFLRKEPIPMDGAATGWVLITYQEYPLGWVKNLGNRINNYYPKEWRVRMS
ncbi:methyltransferase RsmF C-terminal domain-like protein [Lunatimonas lonarensis]|nr:tRNA/rRNA cytosine-C5-methylase [Lunatimonas lonarensis]